MIMRIVNGMTILKADAGKWLKSGDSHSNTDIYLGAKDKVENWAEVDVEPVPIEPLDVEQTITEMEGLV